MTQLQDLARPFPSKFVADNPTGYGSYVAHHIVNQRLLQIVGPFNFGVQEVIRGSVPEVGIAGKDGYKPALQGVVVGVIGRLSCAIDDRFVTIEEAGDCENPRNWPHDGARLKDATSDAFKRCAMRLGVGLHLWSQGDYYLYDALKRDEESAGGTDESTSGDTGTPDDTPPAAQPGEAA